MSDAAFRPRSTSEILDAAIQLFRERFTPLLVISAVATLPSIVVGVINAVFFLPEIMTPASFSPGAVLKMYPLAIVAFLWHFVVDGASVMVVAEAYEGRNLDPAEAMRRAFALGGSILGSVILKFLIVLGWMFLGMMIGGILATGVMFILAGDALKGGAVSIAAVGAAVLGSLIGFGFIIRPVIRYFGTTPAVVLEGKSAVESLRRSKEVSRGSFGKIFGTMISVYILYFIVYFAAFALLSAMLPSKWLAQMFVGLVAVLAAPIVPVTITLLYYDLRMRKEGLDLDLMARRLGGHPQPDSISDAPVA